MSFYTVNKIEVASFLKVHVFIAIALSVVAGLIIYFLSAVLPVGFEFYNISFGERLLKFVLFVIISTIIIEAFVCVAVCVYNAVAKKFGKGVSVLLEPKE